MTKYRIATDKGRYYQIQDETVPSVTNILSKGMPKPALVGWGIKMVAEGAVELANDMPTMLEKLGTDGLLKHLKGLPYSQRDAAADLGTSIHDVAEATVLGTPLPLVGTEAEPFVKAWEGWMEHYKPEFVLTEAVVVNTAQHYAGTLDGICEIEGESWLVDYKTGKGVYPEAVLQANAYANADKLVIGGRGDQEITDMPHVDRAGVVHLRPEGWRMYEAPLSEELFRYFLYVREVARFVMDVSGGLVGEPIGGSW